MSLDQTECGHLLVYKADFLTENTVEYFTQIFNLSIRLLLEQTFKDTCEMHDKE